MSKYMHVKKEMEDTLKENNVEEIFWKRLDDEMSLVDEVKDDKDDIIIGKIIEKLMEQIIVKKSEPRLCDIMFDGTNALDYLIKH